MQPDTRGACPRMGSDTCGQGACPRMGSDTCGQGACPHGDRHPKGASLQPRLRQRQGARNGQVWLGDST